MGKRQEEKSRQLGMPYGTAQGKLKKLILFSLVQKLGLDICFQCGEKIETIRELSIEHKKKWLYDKNAKEVFFDLDNIAFSHLTCNCRDSRRRATHTPEIRAMMSKKHTGEGHPQSKLTDDMVRYIREKTKISSCNCRELAKELKISPTMVYQVKNNKKWTHVK